MHLKCAFLEFGEMIAKVYAYDKNTSFEYKVTENQTEIHITNEYLIWQQI